MWFDRVIMGLILANCVVLSMYDPLLPPGSAWNTLLAAIETIFTVLFTLECVVLVISRGFLFGDTTYLRDPWRVMDFIIVITGLVSFSPSASNLTGFRTMRALKPLKTINGVPGMRMLVSTLLDSIPLLIDVLVLLLWLFCVFGILGIQQFLGRLNSRCFEVAPRSEVGAWRRANGFVGRAGRFLQECAALTGEVRGVGANGTAYVETTIRGEPHQFASPGVVELDGETYYTCVRWDLVTSDMEGRCARSIREHADEAWAAKEALDAERRQRIQDLVDAGDLDDPTDFVGDQINYNKELRKLNQRYQKQCDEDRYCIAVQHNATDMDCLVSDVFRREVAELEALDVVPWLELVQEQANVPCGDRICALGAVCADIGESPNYGYTSFDNIFWAVLNIFHTMTLQGWAEVMYLTADGAGVLGYIFFPLVVVLGGFLGVSLMTAVIAAKFSQLSALENKSAQDAAAASAWRERVSMLRQRYPALDSLIEWATSRASWRERLLPVVENKSFENAITCLIMLNTLSMAVEYHGQPTEMTVALKYMNYFFTGAFAIEMVLKILAYNFVGYMRSAVNAFDFVLVIASIVEIALEGSGLSVLRTFRLMRVLRTMKFIRQHKGLRMLFKTVLKGIGSLGDFGAVLLLFVFIFTVLGMQLMGGASGFENTRRNFNSFSSSFLTVFEMLTGANWFLPLWNAMRSVGVAMSFYFVLWITLGNWVLLNLFLAILLENFASQDRVEDVDLEQRALEERDMKDSRYQELKRRQHRRKQRVFQSDCNRVRAWLASINFKYGLDSDDGEDLAADDDHDSDDGDDGFEGIVRFGPTQYDYKPRDKQEGLDGVMSPSAALAGAGMSMAAAGASVQPPKKGGKSKLRLEQEKAAEKEAIKRFLMAHSGIAMAEATNSPQPAVPAPFRPGGGLATMGGGIGNVLAALGGGRERRGSALPDFGAGDSQEQAASAGGGGYDDFSALASRKPGVRPAGTPRAPRGESGQQQQAETPAWLGSATPSPVRTPASWANSFRSPETVTEATPSTAAEGTPSTAAMATPSTTATPAAGSEEGGSRPAGPRLRAREGRAGALLAQAAMQEASGGASFSLDVASPVARDASRASPTLPRTASTDSLRAGALSETSEVPTETSLSVQAVDGLLPPRDNEADGSLADALKRLPQARGAARKEPVFGAERKDSVLAGLGLDMSGMRGFVTAFAAVGERRRVQDEAAAEADHAAGGDEKHDAAGGGGQGGGAGPVTEAYNGGDGGGPGAGADGRRLSLTSLGLASGRTRLAPLTIPGAGDERQLGPLLVRQMEEAQRRGDPSDRFGFDQLELTSGALGGRHVDQALSMHADQQQIQASVGPGTGRRGVDAVARALPGQADGFLRERILRERQARGRIATKVPMRIEADTMYPMAPNDVALPLVGYTKSTRPPVRGKDMGGPSGDDVLEANSATNAPLDRMELDVLKINAKTGEVVRDTKRKADPLKQVNEQPVFMNHRSLFLFPPNSLFRRVIFAVATDPRFEATILGLIGVSSIALALDEPGLDPNGKLASGFWSLDVGLIVAFTLEAMVKIVTRGFALHPGAYIRSAWNCLDGFIVLTSILSLFFDDERLLIVRSFRLLRALRPLRMISRLRGMQLVVTSLIRAIPSVINVLAFGVFLFLIFGILGVQLFGGTFYSCVADTRVGGKDQCVGYCLRAALSADATGGEREQVCFGYFDDASCSAWLEEDWGGARGYHYDAALAELTGSAVPANGAPLFESPEAAQAAFYATLLADELAQAEYDTGAELSVEELLEAGTEVDAVCVEREWLKPGYTFDNLFQAYVSLFVVATLDNWMSIAFHAIDSVAVDRQPIEGNQPIMAAYFVIFVVLGSFFWFNLLVGVIIDHYTRIMALTGDMLFTTDSQRKWGEALKLKKYENQETKARPPPKNALRRRLYFAVTAKRFEIAVMACICANVFVMMTQYEGQSRAQDSLQLFVNKFFSIVFIAECVVKIAALGFVDYWSDDWNKFDLLVTLINVPDTFDLIDVDIGASVVRIFRLARMFKVFNSAKGLRALFNTFALSLPAIGNVGSLLFLVLYVYAVLGMNLFGELEHSTYLTAYVNFETFGSSLQLLFRVFTGDSWSDVQLGTAGCGAPSTDSAKADCGVGVFSALYFITFIVLASFVMLNLILAIILDRFVEAATSEGLLSTNSFFDALHRKMLLDKFLKKLVDKLAQRQLGFSTFALGQTRG